ncbi:MAG: antibiotic biosynthesis monooxygenase [Proteobacteria bacterium]|nr:antibiotic biosynthesis monooxygenase [Pseudomonadota bacterium]
MAIIGKHNDVFTVMVDFKTTPEAQEEVVATMKKLADLFPSQPGFISQHFHRSHDGSRVVCYVQWRTEQDHLNCYNNPELEMQGVELARLVESGKAEMSVHTYTIVHSNDTPLPGPGNGAEATKELVLKYFNSWQNHDWETMRACLADELDFEGPQGPATMSADQFAEMCSKGSPWRDVELIDSLFLDGQASLLYRAIDTKNDTPVRVGEFVTVRDGKVAKMRAAFSFGTPTPV